MGRPQSAPVLEVRAHRVQRALPGLGIPDPCLVLRGWVNPRGLRIELRDDARESSVCVELDVLETGCVTVCELPSGETAAPPGGWAMEQSDSPGDVFRQLRTWAAHRCGLGPDATRAAPRRRAKRQLDVAPIFDGLRELMTTALGMCSQDALREARRFSLDARLPIYRWLMEDETGRLLQLARVAPGALAFALALDRADDLEGPVACALLLDEVVRGRALNHTLDDAIDRWAHLWNHTTTKPQFVPFSRPEEIRAIQLKKRHLIRAAPADVTPASHWAPPPLVLVPEELPRKPAVLSRWYAVLAQEDRLLHIGRDHGRLGDLGRFLSRSFVELDRSDDIFSVVPQIIDHAFETDRWPTRSTSVARLLAEMRQRAAFGDKIQRASTSAEPGKDPPLQPGPLCGTRPPLGVVATLLATAGELYEEACRMRHCAADLAHEAFGGWIAVYRVQVGAERLTLAFERVDDSRELFDCRGFANQDPSPSALATLERWLDRAILLDDGPPGP